MGQNEDFRPLHDQLACIQNPAFGLGKEKHIRIHLGVERFLTRFPNAPLWSGVGVQLPSVHHRTGYSFYLRYAEEGIFRKVVPGAGYGYYFNLGKYGQHQVTLGAGLEVVSNSINQIKIIGDAGDPLTQDNFLSYSSIIPIRAVNYQLANRYSGNTFDFGLVARKGFGFNRSLTLLAHVMGELKMNRTVVFTPGLYASISNAKNICEIRADLKFIRVLSVGVSYLTDQRFGFHFSLPLDIVYNEDHRVDVGFRFVFQPPHLIPIGGTSFGVAVNYGVERG